MQIYFWRLLSFGPLAIILNYSLKKIVIVQIGLKTGDLDLQGQIGLETYNFVGIPVNVTTFELFGILAANLKCVFERSQLI